MSSIPTGPSGAPPAGPGTSAGVLVAAALEELTRSARVLADLAAEGRLVELPAVSLVDLAEQVHRSGDLLAAVGTVAVHAVHVTGALTGSGSGFASTSQWLQSRCGLSKPDARVTLARGYSLADSYSPTRDAWLAGEVSGGSVREITLGMRRALRALPAADRPETTARAQGVLLDVARVGTVADVSRAVERLRQAVDPDGARQAAMDAYDEQSVSFARVGAMARVTAWLTLENEAALRTLLEARVDRWYRDGALHPEDQPITPTEAQEERYRRARRPHLLALALADVVESALADPATGNRHGVRPHVALTVDLDTYLARQGGELNVPGEMPVLLPSETVARVLCDADLTPILTRHHDGHGADGTGWTGEDGPGWTRQNPDGHGADGPAWTGEDVDGWRDLLAAALREQTRSLLWLGRSRRTADTRLWTAVVARDRHCIFPDCTVDPSRCEVHHPMPWEYGGSTDPENSALLCVRHHHAVHEGGWLMTPVDGADPLAPDYWRFTPPPPRPRPW